MSNYQKESHLKARKWIIPNRDSSNRKHNFEASWTLGSIYNWIRLKEMFNINQLEYKLKILEVHYFCCQQSSVRLMFMLLWCMFPFLNGYKSFWQYEAIKIEMATGNRLQCKTNSRMILDFRLK